MTQVHVEPPPIPLVKGKYDGKLDKYLLKLKLRRDPNSIMSDLYEFKMSLFDNVDPEEFLLFVRNFNMTLTASGMMEMGAKVQYLCTLVDGESLLQFDSLSYGVECTEPLTVEYIIKGLVLYFFPVNFLSKQKCAMCHGMSKQCIIKVRRYINRFIDLNEYLASFSGAKFSHKIGLTELNEILLKIMPNICSKKAYVQGFDCKSIFS